MSPDRLHDRIVDQFSYRGEHAAIWRAFDRVLDTDHFLNLGYSRWYQPHVVGSSQRRLAAKVGADLARRLPRTRGVPLLDVGCGRGGPSIHLADAFGFDVVGVDLVPFNVATARANATRAGVPASFVVGDASRLPLRADAVAVATAIDSIVYVPGKAAVFEELARVVRDGGRLAVSDLVVRDDPTPAERRRVDGFSDAWDMPRLATVEEYRRAIGEAGFAVDAFLDVSPNSTGRFRTWTGPFLWLVDHLGVVVVEPVLAAVDVDAAAATTPVRRAHEALPSLRHVLVYARNES